MRHRSKRCVVSKIGKGLGSLVVSQRYLPEERFEDAELTETRASGVAVHRHGMLCRSFKYDAEYGRLMSWFGLCPMVVLVTES